MMKAIKPLKGRKKPTPKSAQEAARARVTLRFDGKTVIARITEPSQNAGMSVRVIVGDSSRFTEKQRIDVQVKAAPDLYEIVQGQPIRR